MNEYLKGRSDVVRETTPISSILSREPSSYLPALLKFEPEHKLVLNLIFRNGDSTDQVGMSLLSKFPTHVFQASSRCAHDHML